VALRTMDGDSGEACRARGDGRCGEGIDGGQDIYYHMHILSMQYDSAFQLRCEVA